MENKNIELQRCPHCDSDSIKLYKSQTGFWYQCSMCWTGGKKGATKEEAAESWNAIKYLQKCPNCGSELVRLNKSRSRFWYECDGDCWTQGDKCRTVEEAVKAWNKLEPTPKKTNFEALQELGIANFAVFLQTWQEEHGINWTDMTEDEIINWLGDPLDSELEAIINS